MASARFFVTGLVQGVNFRAATRERAHVLGLTGYARNLADGRVEVVAHGGMQAIDELEKWLRRGPQASRVDALVREACDDPPSSGFVRI